MTIGQKLMKKRKELGLSQEEVAFKLDVTRQTISNWELGETTPDLEQGKKLSQLYQVSLDELVENDQTGLLEAKISNTEKLAGMIIKIVKGIGVFLLIYLVAILCFAIYAMIHFRNTEKTTQMITSAQVTCQLDKQELVIAVNSDDSFSCFNCSQDLEASLEGKVDSQNVPKSVKKITSYITSIGGTCDE